MYHGIAVGKTLTMKGKRKKNRTIFPTTVLAIWAYLDWWKKDPYQEKEKEKILIIIAPKFCQQSRRGRAAFSLCWAQFSLQVKTINWKLVLHTSMRKPVVICFYLCLNFKLRTLVIFFMIHQIIWEVLRKVIKIFSIRDVKFSI